MSRVSNLKTIRLNHFNSWHCSWYEQRYTSVLIANDIKIQCYISGVFKRLKTISSSLYINKSHRFTSFHFDLYIEPFFFNSKYRSLFLELNKYVNFCFYFYHSYFYYSFLKKKQPSLNESIQLSSNSALDNKFNFSTKKTLFYISDVKKHHLFSVSFHQSKKKMWSFYSFFFKQLFSLFEEKTLDSMSKYLIYDSLNFFRLDKYSLVQDWTEHSFFFYSVNNANIIMNQNLFHLLFFLNIRPFKCLPDTSLFFPYLFNSFGISSHYNTSLYTDESFFFPTHFSNVSGKQSVSTLTNYWLSLSYFFFSFFFSISSYLSRYVFFFSFFYSEISFIKVAKGPFLSSFFLSKHFHSKSKKFLKRVKSSDQLRFMFVSKTYLKKYFFFFFRFFLIEMERTIGFYLHKQNKLFSNILLNANLFSKGFNHFPSIKDARFVANYISMGLNDRFSLNRIFYSLRDLQFKNYYHKNFLYKKHSFDFMSLVADKKYPVLGLRIECSGSYKPGSRKKKKYYGEVVKDVELVHKSPNNSYYADLDFHQSFSRLKSGTIGIKVWVFFKTDLYNKNKHYVSIVTSS